MTEPTTTKHFSEAELLETYYLQPGESMPVMMHLAECSDCAARYERLEAKLRGHACATDRERPDTFWKRQRIAITRSIAANNHRAATARRSLRVAAAAVFAFFLGGAVVYRTLEPQTHVPATTSASARIERPAPPPNANEEITLEHDAWQSDELRDFHNVVEWESWVPETKAQKGTRL